MTGNSEDDRESERREYERREQQEADERPREKKRRKMRLSWPHDRRLQHLSDENWSFAKRTRC